MIISNGRPSAKRRTPRLFRFVNVEFRSGILVCRFEQAAVREHCVLRRHCQSVIEGLVDFVAVDRQRERSAKSDIAHLPARIVVACIQIREEDEVRSLAHLPRVDAVIRTLLGQLLERKVVKVQIARLQVRFARACFGRHEPFVSDHEHHLIDIPRLAAFRIETMLVRIVIEGTSIRR